MTTSSLYDTEHFRATCRECGKEYLGVRLVMSSQKADTLGVCNNCRHPSRDTTAIDARIQAAHLEADRESRRIFLVRAQEQKRREQALAELDVPPLYAQATLANFQDFGSPADRRHQQRVRDYVERYLEHWSDVAKLVLFRGSPGTGKGHLVWTIARHLIARDVWGRVIKFADLLRAIRETWRDRDGPSEAEVLDRFRNVPFLAIDDVSRHAYFAHRVCHHLYDIIDHRLEHGRPTVLTSNERDDALVSIFGEALIDRLQGAGGLLDFGSASWRLHTGRSRDDVAQPVP